VGGMEIVVATYAGKNMFENRDIFSADLHPVLCNKERFCRPKYINCSYKLCD
jgi:hypothetical protein